MKAVSFKDQTIIIAEDQKEYNQLPALVIDSREGYVITKWRLSLWERLRILFKGHFWLTTMTFNNNFQPVSMTTYRKEAYLLPTDKEYVTVVSTRENA